MDTATAIALEQRELLAECIETIGMGRHQWSLFFLCGCGWACDSMYTQVIGVILPQTQKEFGLNDIQASLLNVFLLIGLTCGSIFWGCLSDMIGRKPSFMWTLGIATVFSVMASISANYAMLCAIVLLMSFGVGGNIPVDASIFIEFVPQKNQSQVALLSIFWPIVFLFITDRDNF
jgi:MFS family permease